jgi:hypothetical protein
MSHGARRYLLDTRFSRIDETNPTVPAPGNTNPNFRPGAGSSTPDLWRQHASTGSETWGREGGGYKPGSITMNKLNAPSLRINKTISQNILP